MTERNHRPGALWTVAVLALGFVLYVLSSGPTAWLIGRCGWPEYLLVPYEVIFKPLDMAQNALPANVAAPYERYMAWWLLEFTATHTGPSYSPPIGARPASGGKPESAESAPP